MPWSEEEQILCMSLEKEHRINYRSLWYSLTCVSEEGGCRPEDKSRTMEDCMKFINALMMDKQDYIKGQYYNMRLSTVTGGVYDESECKRKLPAYSLMHGDDVSDIRIEIFRWGRPRKWGVDGVDRYTVGEYEIRKTECELHVFNLPSIIQSSDQDSGMFLGCGWASVLIHMRVLIGFILGHTFTITCAHENTAYALKHYEGLCKRDRGKFTFTHMKWKNVAHKALYLLMSKIQNPKNSSATYQLRMNGLVDTRDRYRGLIV